MTELRLPELGEGIERVDVAAVMVAVGDTVRRDQPVVEVETEKASLEVPATADGQVSEVLVKVGDQVSVGQVLIRVETTPGPSGEKEAPSAVAGPPVSAEPVLIESRQPAPIRSEAVARPEPLSSPVVSFPGSAPPRDEIATAVPAAPSVRALARQLGVDITRVPGSGPGGRISRDDVKAFTKKMIVAAGEGGAALSQPRLPDFAQWGEVESRRMSSLRRATARGMATAWSTVPHVTQFDHADITQLDSMRRRFNTRAEAKGQKLSMSAIVIKMVASVLKHFPTFNASLDLDNETVIYKKYIHIGVAVDTDRGLLVPVIRDSDRKNLIEIAVELTDLAARARGKKLSPDEMRGASFTVSNLGGLGTTYFTPIVNWPEVAILGVGRSEQRAVFEDGQFQPRAIMPLSVSYDHRLIDGAEAARFLRKLAEALEQPLLLLLDE